MKNILLLGLIILLLQACGDTSNVDFESVKVFDDKFNVSLETNEKNLIIKLNSLFNNKVEQKTWLLTLNTYWN